MDETPRVRRRWLCYGLPVLLALMALVAVVLIPFAVKLEQAERQRAAVEAIRRLGGVARYDYQRDQETREGGAPPGPAWLRELFGVDMVASVVNVELGPQKPVDAGFDDAGLQQLEEPLKALPRLEWLGVDGAKVTDAGLKHLAGLSQVKRLYIWGTSITDSGLEHIQGLTQLESLVIRETGITDAGLRRLAGLKHLTRLDLTKTKITGPGLRHLEGLENLKLLHLGQTKITDAGLEYLTGFHHLKELYLGDTHVTEEGVKKLREALPNCRISRRGH
jgi:Leucine-rich repeat (LRR) protein